MKITTTIFLLLFSTIICAQNTFKYSSYKSAGHKSLYNIMVSYDNNQELNYVLISVESTDPLFKKSTFILNKINFLKFTAYLRFLELKMIEYDYINKASQVSKIEENIRWNEPIEVYCSYEDGPKNNTSLTAIYAYQNGLSSLMVLTNDIAEGYLKAKKSQIFFASPAELDSFLKKIEISNISMAIKKNYAAKSRLN